jgi:putative transposase
LKNARNYYLHKITKEITDNNDIIVTEKLQTKNMLQDKKISKSIIDASFHEIIRQLQYKAKNKGKYFYQIDTFYPSTQTCSVCGNIDSKYKDLTKRDYNCCNCKNTLDRDLNASINIMFEGLKLHMKNIV